MLRRRFTVGALSTKAHRRPVGACHRSCNDGMAGRTGLDRHLVDRTPSLGKRIAPTAQSLIGMSIPHKATLISKAMRFLRPHRRC